MIRSTEAATAPCLHSLAFSFPTGKRREKAAEGLGKVEELREMDRNWTGIALEVLHEGPEDLNEVFPGAFSRTPLVAPGGRAGHEACPGGRGRG